LYVDLQSSGRDPTVIEVWGDVDVLPPKPWWTWVLRATFMPLAFLITSLNVFGLFFQKNVGQFVQRFGSIFSPEKGANGWTSLFAAFVVAEIWKKINSFKYLIFRETTALLVLTNVIFLVFVLVRFDLMWFADIRS
jgi:hypothetical protein